MEYSERVTCGFAQPEKSRAAEPTTAHQQNGLVIQEPSINVQLFLVAAQMLDQTLQKPGLSF